MNIESLKRHVLKKFKCLFVVFLFVATCVIPAFAPPGSQPPIVSEKILTSLKFQQRELVPEDALVAFDCSGFFSRLVACFTYKVG